MSLNADQLDAFWMVVQQGGFHRAAESLFITQSAVTQRIQALEAALGQKLFVRAARGVSLTPAGQALLRHCRDRRDAEASFLAGLSGEATGLSGRFTVASTTVAGRAWVLPALVALGRRHPNLDLALTLGDELAAQALLTTCQADAVLSEAQVTAQGLTSVRVGAMPFALVACPQASAGWPDRPGLDQLVTLRAIDFNPGDRVTLDHLALCWPEADLGALRRHYVNDDQGILEWVLAGGGFSVLPWPVVEKPLAAGRLRHFYPQVRSERAMYLAYAEGVAPQAIADLRAALSAVAQPGGAL